MVLRPQLYQRLRHRVGPVEISDENARMIYTVSRDALTGRPRLNVAISGEYLRVSCPFCTDTRQRLWINHMWGYPHPETGTLNLWLCHCFNEHCLEDYDRQKQLYRMVFDDICNGAPLPDPLIQQARPTQLQPARLPGILHPLHQLPLAHPACDYLLQRGFDPARLSRELQLSYCERAEDWCRHAQNRIIIPVHRRGQLFGWQGRYIGDDHKQKRTIKYFTMPGMRRRDLLYNYDRALSFPYVVLCEGPTDVWRVGPASVALFGKSMTSMQKQLLAAGWGKGVVIILLDGEAHADALKVERELVGWVRQRVLVALQEGEDPGGLSHQEIWARIDLAAQRQNIDLRNLKR